MRYQVRLIGDPDMTVAVLLAQPVRFRTDDPRQAEDMAIAMSGDGPWGAAVIDTVTRQIDWGDHTGAY